MNIIGISICLKRINLSIENVYMLSNGRRSLDEIKLLIEAYYSEIDLEIMKKFLKDLEKAGLIRFLETPLT